MKGARIRGFFSSALELCAAPPLGGGRENRKKRKGDLGRAYGCPKTAWYVQPASTVTVIGLSAGLTTVPVNPAYPPNGSPM